MKRKESYLYIRDIIKFNDAVKENIKPNKLNIISFFKTLVVLFSLFPGPSVGFGREGGGPAGSQSLEKESQSESDPLSLSLSLTQ